MNKMEEFLNQYKGKSTYKSYKTHLNKFFKITNTDPDTYFKRKRNYTNDVKKLWNTLMERDTPPLSIHACLSVVRTFFEDNDIFISRRIWKNIRKRTRGSRALTIDRVPNNSQLKRILSHGTARERALFLVASSSGMRIEEVLQLKKPDIEWNSKPVRINLPGTYTKTGNSRICFMSDEAKSAVEVWLEEKNDYLQMAVKKGKNLRKDGQMFFKKSLHDERIFPFTYSPSMRMWNKLIAMSGYDEKDPTTGRYKMHIHTLRKFFSGYMNMAGMPSDVVDCLLGHEKDLKRVYNKYTPEQLAELYQKSVHSLLIFEKAFNSNRIEEVEEQLKEKDARIRKQEGQIEKLLQAQKAMELQMDIIKNSLKIEEMKNGKK